MAEYEKVRRQYPDTVQGQLQLADWCRQHGLDAQRKTHLERVLQLDPDQAEARAKLGYHKVKDQWMTHAEEMADKGYVLRDGRWMPKPEAELYDDRKTQHAAELEWVTKINRWRNSLDGRQAEQGEKNLREINDPMAVFGLSQKLKKEKNYKVRLMYIEALGNIKHPAARQPLAVCAIDDEVEEVRLTCLDVLQKQSDATVTKYFVGRMRDKNATDEIIDRAGVALGRTKDPSCIPTLIDYLQITRFEEIQNPAGPGAMSAGFSKKGGVGLGMGQKPTIIPRPVQHHSVLEALVAITGQNFGYDQRAWSTWYANQKAAGAPLEAKKG